jgi:hypothetical protein
MRPEHLHGPPVIALFRFPRLFQYAFEVSRRGTGEFLPGVEVTFARTGGVGVSPESFTTTLSEGQGRMVVLPTPNADGDVLGSLIIKPPAPLRAETVAVRLPTHYNDTLFLAGIFGYGPGVASRVELVDRATGAAVRGGTAATFRRVGGLPLVQHPSAVGFDTGLRLTDTLGRALYIVGAPDTGSIVFDVEVPLRGLRPDTVRGVSLRARLSDSVVVEGPFRVGGWFPWLVEVRDGQTDAPIQGARVSFRPGGGLDPTFTGESTAADGRAIIHGVPREAQVRGQLLVRFPSGTHRDTSISGVTLTAMHDDTLRLLRVVRAARTIP